MKRSNVLTFIVKIRGKILLLGRETIIGKQKAVCPTFVSTFFFTLNFRIYFWSSLCPFSYGIPVQSTSDATMSTVQRLRLAAWVCSVHPHTQSRLYLFVFKKKCEDLIVSHSVHFRKTAGVSDCISSQTCHSPVTRCLTQIELY